MNWKDTLVLGFFVIGLAVSLAIFGHDAVVWARTGGWDFTTVADAYMLLTRQPPGIGGAWEGVNQAWLWVYDLHVSLVVFVCTLLVSVVLARILNL